ncbi:hypothetical protein [Alkalitalea saponilacus]|uniref:Lipocalin-like domain-containing protein n=1 Tax=Alkalitalea saponilacus TaxID=889453 RepID=A0A1T5HSF4_9BACT|nr:hypothetical protein [Alkalitalea saponilacus]ASB47701.1 hypothetical protein CDL62_00290 [Alkalitalea saponilacus]SKC23626.1 hypothetical protein SAMN03080601_02905 [Alkalitalea saponilacus]
MKKFLYFFGLSILGVLIFTGCDKDDDFDDALLTGKWQSGTLFERYFANGTGYRWNTADDVREDEAQDFTWTLVKDELTQIHIMEIGGNVPRYYSVTELTSTRLRYEGHGRKYSFTKVNN